MADLKTVTVNFDEQDRPVITVTYGSDDGGGVQADPDAWLSALAERVSDNGALFLTEMLKANEARNFISLVDLATEVGVEKKTVEGWNRNLGRSIKAIVREVGFLRTDQEDGTAQIFDFKWDDPNNQWLYAVPTKYRTTLKHALSSR